MSKFARSEARRSKKVRGTRRSRLRVCFALKTALRARRSARRERRLARARHSSAHRRSLHYNGRRHQNRRTALLGAALEAAQGVAGTRISLTLFSRRAPPLRRRTIKSALSPLSHPRRKRATRTACTRARTRSSSIRARTTRRPSTPSPSRSRRGCSATSLPRRSYSSARARSTSSRPRRRCRSWSR